MKIIIVGCGNVGITFAEQLSTEGHNIMVIDTREQIVEIYNSYDILGVVEMAQVLIFRWRQELKTQIC